MSTFYTSDTHFGSERTLELSRRPFLSVEEMDSKLIANWNNVVSAEDSVRHLGDFGDYTKVKLLNGDIILTIGNYEQYTIETQFQGNFDEFKAYLLELGFKDVVYNIEIQLGSSIIGTAHKPSECDQSIFNIFGHVHKLQMIKKFGLNVGTDCHNFTPISEEVVLFYKNAVEKFYDNDVFCG